MAKSGNENQEFIASFKKEEKEVVRVLVGEREKAFSRLKKKKKERILKIQGVLNIMSMAIYKLQVDQSLEIV